jgi:hypothetical protein
MRRASVGAIGVIGLFIVTGLSAYAVAAPKGPTKHRLTETLIGAQVSVKGSSSESVYKVNSSLDHAGAAIQDVTVTGTTFPLSGKDTFTTYYPNGVARSRDTFTLATLDANGISLITGSGKCLGGTGVHKKEKCTYTFKGTYNSKTTVASVKVTGTDTR